MEANIMISKLYSTIGCVGLIFRLLPLPIQQLVDRMTIQKLLHIFMPRIGPKNLHVRLDIPEKLSAAADGSDINSAFTNSLYSHARLYLDSLHSELSQHRWLNAYRNPHNCKDSSSVCYSLPLGEEMQDKFQGVTVTWKSGNISDNVSTHGSSGSDRWSQEETYYESYSYLNAELGRNGGAGNNHKCLTLEFLHKHRDIILPHYLDHISKVAIQLQEQNSQIYLFTNKTRNFWESIPFDHPSTFDTLALEPGLCDRIMADLHAFTESKDFYRKIGRPWKRGYLLYGPPGTGKSSMVAAIANMLHYDIYDLELGKVRGNTELKSLLLETTPKSIIVIEDIDCSLLQDLQLDRQELERAGTQNEISHDGDAPRSKLTLSGILNFADGLWSCCGEQRIFIFTTNHRDRLDPALLRPGRMDMHILLSYISYPALQRMAKNYLGISEDHSLFPKIEELMKENPEHKLTPAAISEILIGNQNDPDTALGEIINKIQQEQYVPLRPRKPRKHKKLKEIPADEHKLTPAAISDVLTGNQNDPDAALGEIMFPVVPKKLENTRKKCRYE